MNQIRELFKLPDHRAMSSLSSYRLYVNYNTFMDCKKMLNISSVDFCSYTFGNELVALQLIGPRSFVRFPTRTTRRIRCNLFSNLFSTFQINHKNHNFLDCDWLKKTPIFPLIHLPSCYSPVVIGQFVS